jgi:hypothetical protein
VNYWSWTGRPVGYRERNYLYNWNHDAVGQFKGQDVYDPDGKYLGEVRSRLLTRNPSRAEWRWKAFTAPPSGMQHPRPSQHADRAMLPGFEDFPDV